MNPFDVGASVDCQAGIPPKNSSAATTNGTGIDRTAFNSVVLHVACGAASGTPSTQSVAVKLQECATSGGTYTDITGAAATTLTADNTESEVDVNLQVTKQFIRVVAVVSFTGGTSPAIPISATLVWGGARKLPA